MKKLLPIISCLWVFNLNAQKVQLTVQTGHTATINDVKFSPFDDFIATAGADNRVVIWDFASGKQYKVLLGHLAPVHSVDFHHDNEILLTASSDSTLLFWDYQTGILKDSLKFNFDIHTAAFTPTGDQVLVGGDQLVIVDYPILKVNAVSIRPKFEFTALAISDDENFLMVGGAKEPFSYLIDLKSKTLMKKFTHSMIAASFDLAKQTIYFSTNNGLAYSYNWKKEKKKGLSTDIMLNTVNDIIVDEKSIYVADDYGVIRVLEKRKWFQKAVFKGRLGKLTALDQSHDKRYLIAAGKRKSAVVWDLQENRVVKVMKGVVSRVNDIAFSKDGRNILVVYEDGSMRNTDLITNQSVVNRLAINSEVLSKIGYFSIIHIKEFTDERAEMLALYKQSSFDMEGVYDELEQYKVSWNFEKNLITLEEQKELDPYYEHYIKSLKRGVYLDNSYFRDSSLLYTSSDSFHIQAKIQGPDLIVSYKNGEEKAINTGHSDIISSVAINEKYGFIATSSWDGMIRFWDVESLQLLTIFGAFGDGQFVYIDPDGYYFSSKNALSYIGFSLGNHLYAFEQFDLKYNRPDLVIKDLPYFDDFYQEAFEKAYYKRLSKLGIQEDQLELSKDLPKLEILNNPAEALNGNELTIQLKCESKNSDLSIFHLFVNGVPEFGRFGKNLTGRMYQDEIKLQLNPGTNYIQCYVTNQKSASSLKQSVLIEAPKSQEKSDLYLLTIGVSTYAQSNYNLSYASKDARDVKEYFDLSRSFDKIHTQMLLDAAATKENILSMRDYFAEADINDVVVLFVAGHGVLDDELDYYFAPHDMNFIKPEEKGVPFEIFDEILDDTKCRKKVMFLDACHSGEIDKDEVIKSYIADEEEEGELQFRRVGRTIKNINEINSFELSRALFADMRISNGSTVISSSGGAEYAIEGAKWHNGVFTYALLKGLRDKEADLNRDKRISVGELQLYVQSEVNNLTNGKQTPTSRVENLNYDFIIQE